MQKRKYTAQYKAKLVIEMLLAEQTVSEIAAKDTLTATNNLALLMHRATSERTPKKDEPQK